MIKSATNINRILTLETLVLGLGWVASGLGAQTSATAAKPPSDGKGRWVVISEAVTSQVKSAWPGLTTGVVVDRVSGDLYMAVPGQGIWKSTDQGASFTRVDGSVIGGRCETGYSLCADPNGNRFYCFMLDGPSGCTLDGGKTWEKLAQIGRGWDFAAVDWSVAKPQIIFGAEHESGGKYWLSSDGGKRWQKLGEDPAIRSGFVFGVGVANAQTLLCWRNKGGIERSLDAGKTWTKVSEEIAVSHVMMVFKNTCYWLGEKGLLVSKDAGARWTVQGRPMQAAWGPYFGKDEKHVVVVGKSGIQETTDGGENWQVVGALPAELKDLNMPGWFLNFAYDPVNNIFYASRMGKPTFKYER